MKGVYGYEKRLEFYGQKVFTSFSVVKAENIRNRLFLSHVSVYRISRYEHDSIRVCKGKSADKVVMIVLRVIAVYEITHRGNNLQE